MSTATLPKSESLTEFTTGVGGNVDTENHVIKNVKILGLESKNGRRYTEAAIRNAASMYEGAKVNVNHPKGKASEPRGYEERFGHFDGVNVRPDGLYGDFHYNPKHRIAEQFVYDAQKAPNNGGFSHNVEARTSRANGQLVIEAITRVVSVDLVADPATTKGIFESIQEPDAMSLTEVTLEQIKTARPDLVSSILTEAKQSAEAKDRDARFALLEAENKALKAEKAAGERKAVVNQKLSEAKLPEVVLTDAIRDVCYGMDDAKLGTYIESLQGIAKGLPSKPSGQRPKSSEQTPGGSQVTENFDGINDSASFIAALCD